MKRKKILLLAIILSIIGYASAQEIVYKPINPSFLGGNSFNASWLLSNASSQNKFKEAGATKETKSELDKFTESLNRQLLNQISRDLFNNQFGDSSLQEGTFTFGSLVIEVTPGLDGMTFDIFDTSTGEQTTIIIPN